MLFLRTLSLGLVLFALAETGSRAAFIQLTASEVTGIMESYPSNNLGALEWFPVGAIQNFNCGTTNQPLPCENRGLIRFDLTGVIPPGSRIKKVDFRVAVSLQPPADEGEPSQFFDIHRLFVPWGEGTGVNQPGKFPGEVGRPAQAGESSWFMRQYPSNAWAIPGGAAGVDFASLPSGTGFISDEISASPFLISSISNRMEADFQLWLEHPEQNHGWLMKVRNLSTNAFWSAKRFETPEAGIAGFPLAEITYVPPPRITQFKTNGPGVSFQFVTDNNQPYLVQFRDSLTEGNWQNLAEVPAFPQPVTVFFFDSIGTTNAPQRFYRVIAP